MDADDRRYRVNWPTEVDWPSAVVDGRILASLEWFQWEISIPRHRDERTILNLEIGEEFTPDHDLDAEVVVRRIPDRSPITWMEPKHDRR